VERNKKGHVVKLRVCCKWFKRFSLLTGFLLSPPVEAQLRGPGSPQEILPPLESRFLYYEAFNHFSTSTGLSRIDILYRIDQSFFIAVKDPDSAIEPKFLKRGELVIELVDSLGVSQARTIRHLVIETNSGETMPPGTQWIEGSTSFDLKPDLYTMVLSIEDAESSRRLFEKNRRVRVKDFSAQGPNISTPLFIEWHGDSSLAKDLRPQNFGGTSRFGESSACVLALQHRLPADPLQVEYSIRASSSRTSDRLDSVFFQSDKALFFHGYSLEDTTSNHEPVYDLLPSGESDLIIVLPLPTHKLPLDSYRLHVSLKGQQFEWKDTVRFGLVWPRMPRSLHNIRDALRAMQHITTKDELDSLSRGNDEEREGRFREYWALKDHTPETAYNEVMVEYFERIDKATERFSTLREVEGWKTDRGKIFVLYGEPTSIERKLDPSGYREIWLYEKIGKRFIFVDESRTGDYRLSSSQTL
jgi:GWxTD domain-containing protein